MIPCAQWEELDILDNKHIKIIFNKFYQFFNRIVCNPPFDKGIYCLKLGAQLIEQTKGMLFFILPIDFFMGSKKRKDEWQQINLEIQMCYITRRWNYYPQDSNSKEKVTMDAIWVLKYIAKPQEKSSKYHTYQVGYDDYNKAQEVSEERIRALRFIRHNRVNSNIHILTLRGGQQRIQDWRKEEEETKEENE